MSNDLKTSFKTFLFLLIRSIESMVGKQRGRGEVLLVDSLLATCLKVYKNPTTLINCTSST